MASNSKKQPAEAASYIHERNPEILKAEPRPGGAVTLVNTGLEKNIKAKNETLFKIEEQVSREFRVHTALEEGIYAEEVEEVTVPNPLKDAMFLMSVSLSTVMMMAAGADYLPDQHLDYTQAYLNCIRDDYGVHPPNIQALLNHLAKLRGSQGDGEPEVPASGEQTVRSVTRVKMGSQGEVEPEPEPAA